MVTVPLPHLAGPRRRRAGRHRRPRPDHGRVRLGPDGRQSGNSSRGSRTTSWSSCWRTNCCTWRCARTTARRAAARSSSTMRTTTSSTTSCASNSASRRSRPAGSTCRARARNRPRRSCSRFAQGRIQMQSQTRVWEGRAVAGGPGVRRQAGGRRRRAGSSSERRRRCRRRARRRARARAGSRTTQPSQAENARRIEELAAKGLALAKAHGRADRARGTDSRRRRSRS